MIKQTKLTDEEFAKVQEIQKEYQIIAYQIGELSLMKYNLKKQLDEINTEIDNIQSTGYKQYEKEKELAEELKTKYPDVTINFETGELS